MAVIQEQYSAVILPHCQTFSPLTSPEFAAAVDLIMIFFYFNFFLTMTVFKMFNQYCNKDTPSRYLIGNKNCEMHPDLPLGVFSLSA